MTCRPMFLTAWAMPNRRTFQIAPIAAFLDRWLYGCDLIADPFCGTDDRAHLRNDLGHGGIDAEEWCNVMLLEHFGRCDAVLFDPPYSPRQISECYKNIGRPVTAFDTRNAALYARVRKALSALLKPGGVALSFGWQSSGFGKAFVTEEILLVQHGGAHNDTICVAQRKPTVSSSASRGNG